MAQLTTTLMIVCPLGQPCLSPQIVATPSSVMVNNTTQLVGRHFAPRHRLTVEECSLTSWYVPQNPCDTAKTITVTTNRYGTFQHTFTVDLCPSSGPPMLAVTCYIGVPMVGGVDTEALLGAATMTVTYP